MCPFPSHLGLFTPAVSLTHLTGMVCCVCVQGGGYGELRLKVTYWPFELIDFHKGEANSIEYILTYI